MMLDMTKVKFTDEAKGSLSKIRCLVYGLPKSGKTHFASTWPNPFALDFDKGLLTARDKHIPFYDIDRGADAYEVTRELLERIAFKKEGFEKIETVVLDSITSMNDFFVTAAMKKAGKDITKEKAGFDEWGKLLAQCIDIVSFTKDFPEKFGINVVATAWPEAVESDIAGYKSGKEGKDVQKTDIMPMMQGKYKNRAAGDFDEFYYSECTMAMGKPTFILHTSSYCNYHGGSRIFRNTDYKIQNTYEALIAKAKEVK